MVVESFTEQLAAKSDRFINELFAKTWKTSLKLTECLIQYGTTEGFCVCRPLLVRLTLILGRYLAEQGECWQAMTRARDNAHPSQRNPRQLAHIQSREKSIKILSSNGHVFQGGKGWWLSQSVCCDNHPPPPLSTENQSNWRLSAVLFYCVVTSCSYPPTWTAGCGITSMAYQFLLENRLWRCVHSMVSIAHNLERKLELWEASVSQPFPEGGKKRAEREHIFRALSLVPLWHCLTVTCQTRAC